jgi:hypothetical protein
MPEFKRSEGGSSLTWEGYRLSPAIREIQLAAPLSLPCLHLYSLKNFNPSSLLNEQEQELLKEQNFWSLGCPKTRTLQLGLSHRGHL